MGLTSLSGTFQVSLKWNAQQNINSNSANYQPLLSSGSLSPVLSYGNGAAFTPTSSTTGGCDEIVSLLLSVPATSSASIDSTSITNILQTTGVNLARIRGYMFQLLSLTNDPINGSSASSVTWGNGSNKLQMNLSTTGQSTIKSGGQEAHFDPSTAGYTTSGSVKSITFNNNDASTSATMQITLIGSTT